MRLDKFLSAQGLSRKQARAAIASGQVLVNGEVQGDPGFILDPISAQVLFQGRALGYRRHMHLMLHKPAGLLTATTDARQKTVMDLLPEELKRRALGPVGRLDKDVTGLLLLTDDGQLAHRLISPKWTVEKVYLARVEGALDATDIQAFQAGIALSDFTARPARLEILEPDLGRLTITEGKFHQVKRMFAARGKPVLRLHRESVGGVSLDSALECGKFRPLTAEEEGALYALVRMER
ncbi:MAG TPA: rRNA pseudouridine synthase [Candidatus Faecaligallichristensenella faecipullorum]|nr:rRNA pseudouridine synthase [Candidatus Faecaligallichristensenella faecipullorum]